MDIPARKTLRKDITGKKINRLMAVRYSHFKSNHSFWVFLCDCGNYKTIRMDLVTRGTTKSCGCLNKEIRRTACKTHGMSQTSLYRRWASMADRCRNKNNPKYNDYGGRGIYVCEHWHSFVNFYNDMGHPPFKNAEIDRINNDNGYSKENCKWSTRTEQNRNKRGSAKVNFNGKTKCISEWAKLYGIDRGTLRSRIHRGWDMYKSLTHPP